MFFGGRCQKALDFCKTALGATIDMIMRFKESSAPLPPGTIPAGWDEKVMHSAFRVGDALVMASDGREEASSCNGFSLSINVATETEADRAFAALSAGGEVTMPLDKTFWSTRFGMVTNRFGVGWMVNVMQAG